MFFSNVVSISRKCHAVIDFKRCMSYCKWSTLLKNDSLVFLKYQNLQGLSLSKILYSTDVDTNSPTSGGQHQFMVSQIRKIKTLSDDDIMAIKEGTKAIGSHINDANFDATFLDICRLENAFTHGRNFFYKLYSQGKYNLASVGKFFRLCYKFSSECNDEDKDLMLKLYNSVLEKFNVLDSRTCENFLLGLSITSKWNEGIKLIEMSKLSGQPSTIMYSTIIEAAFLHNEKEIALDFLHEMAKAGKQPLFNALVAWLESSKSKSSAYEELLKYLEHYNIHPSEDVARWLLKTSEDVNTTKCYPAITSVQNSGICRNCRRPLKQLSVTEKEFNLLKEEFLNPVLIGKDIFQKTKPEELKSFMLFIQRTGQVDYVLDGLNIAYVVKRKSRDAGAQILCDVVQHFIGQSKKVAVIGRKHMESWNKKKMDFIKSNSSLFLADNISADDPLILYTAMHSGLGTCFVSRDQMRSHKFLLKKPMLSSIFSRWQQKHQFYLKFVTDQGKVILTQPLPYLMDPQESEPGSWHIPINTPMDNVPGHLVAPKTQWLCISSG